MARSRRGSFGLQPRVAPNVTNQIVALAREYVAKRDALIMDAWRSGGTFEGKKATDEMVLAYWREREKDLAKGDPEYEQAKNQIMQLTYAIEQSKADLKHVQGKMSDGEYAQFFIRWANKVPANSEFYRVLQKDAAQLIESAKEKARVNGEKARVEAFNNFVKTTQAKDIAIGDAMTAALTDLSNQTGLSITGNGDELLTLLTQNVAANPAQYRALLDTIHAADPHWNGVLDESYLTTHIQQATQGWSLIADRAQKGGYVSAYASATKGEADMALWGQHLKVWPVATSYTNAENSFLRVWNDPNASQMDKQNAAAQFSSRLSTLANTPGIDPGAKTMIEADAQRLLGQDAGDNPSFGAAMLGRAGVDQNTAATVGYYTQLSAEMAANPTAWAYAPVDKNGQFDPSGHGPLGIVPAGTVPPGSQAVVIPGANGQAVMAMVPVHTVYVNDANNPGASPTVAGFQISYNVGGKNVQMWGYKDAQGGQHWSLISPITVGAQTTTDSKGDVYVTPQASPVADPIAMAKQLDKKFGTNITAQLEAQQKAGSPLGGVSVTLNQPGGKGDSASASFELKYDNGVFTANTTQNVLDPATGKVLSSQKTPVEIPLAGPAGSAFSPSRLAAGGAAPGTFNSPLQASVTAASDSQNADQVSKFASDPAFQQAFLSQTMQTLGTSNPFDPRVAAAWKKITTPTAPQFGGQSPDERTKLTGKQRDDLVFPGEKQNAAYQGTLNINFGKVGELNLPGLPSYLGNQNVNLSPFGNAASGLLSGLSTMMPGLGLPGSAPGQTAQGSPAPTITPTGFNVPAPTAITPTSTSTTAGIKPSTAPPLPGLPPPPLPPKPGQAPKAY